jgi:DNA helicase II / ATP-dependent DNA helicase PcrA
MELDSSQLAVATAPVEERLIVTAAAGQGKTEVVMARLEYLADEGVNIFDDVLVLSFSRAAVDSVRRRARQAGITGVNIRTFDSFASEVNSEFGELDRGGFGHRIRNATRLLKDGDADYSNLDHVIIDEGQDLVGDRADFVIALLHSATNAGFTVLGDPLQAIFDFQLQTDNKSSTTSGQFAQFLTEDFGATHLALEKHYRATDERMAALVLIGDRLRELMPEGDSTEAHEVLDSFRRSFGGRSYERSSLSALSGILDLEPGETTAVLGATNYSVLLASEELHEQGFSHSVRRRMQDFGYASWIAQAFEHEDPKRIGRDRFNELLESTHESDGDAVWRALKNLEGNHRDFRYLDMRELNRRMRSVQAPPSLMVSEEQPVVLSTVHRAKGLEFDHVIDMIPNASSIASEKTWETLRQKYVSSSRARESLFLVQEPKKKGLWPKPLDGRWVECGFRGKYRYIRRFELLSGDIDPTAPPPLEGLVGDPDGLYGPLMPGKEVVLQLATPSIQEHETGIYRVLLPNGTAIGRTSRALWEFLDRNVVFRSTKPRTWPELITGGRVVTVETAAGDHVTKDSGDPYKSGFWPVVRIGGLAQAHWEYSEK